MRERLHDDPDAAQLAAMYGRIQDRSAGGGHRERIIVSAAIGVALVEAFPPTLQTVADLSAAEGAIVDRIVRQTGFMPILGDLAPGWDITGALPDTLTELPDGGVGLYVCCETLEHVSEPDVLVAKIRGHAARLLISTPINGWGDDNREHLWAWDRAEVEGVLERAGWQPEFYAQYGNFPCFAIWGCV